jgi:hypothetical protein
MRRYLALVPLLSLAACGGGPAATSPVVTTPPAAVPSSTEPTSAAATSSPAPSATSPAPSGPQYAFLKSSDPATREVTYDLVEWYEGKAAAKACAADGEEPAENDWCVGYYIRNNNTKLRTVKVAGDAKIRVVVDGELKPVELATVGSDMLFKFTIKNGQAVELEHIYLP